ncbi:hypothetical protein [Lacticaseibacillus thailandensis]|uniref:hypothetical protein n=1 Tax=Lacticaseibacillus thailandensis TaxID=381741 RepID=UPI0006D1A512|nr:hypothetical protein [Lacticaseibacillus thailandensis]
MSEDIQSVIYDKLVSMCTTDNLSSLGITADVFFKGTINQTQYVESLPQRAGPRRQGDQGQHASSSVFLPGLR